MLIWITVGRKLFLGDKSTFLLDQLQHGWAPKDQRIPLKSDCFSPKVQIWGSISYYGVVNFTFYEGSMKSDLYIKVKEDNLLPEAPKIFHDDWVF